MDLRAANGPPVYRSCSAEIDIECIVAALAGLNEKISRLRQEIDAFKNANDFARDCSRPAPSEFNDSTKNERRRTGARCEPQRNFKRDDSPGGTDLSARLSFAKRAREVKAAHHEAAVFKEDYPPDDKSIGNDERPDRSRASKPSRTYRESISDAEKFGEETDGRSRDRGNLVGISSSARDDDESRKHGRCQNKFAHDVTYCDCSSGNAVTPKIKRKRISRGVQYDVPIGREKNGYLFLSCFRPRSKKHRTTREAEKKRVSVDEFKSSIYEPGNQVIKAPIEKTISDDARPERSCDLIDKGERSTSDADLYERDNFKFKDNREEIRSATNKNVNGERKGSNKSEDRAAKLNRLGLCRHKILRRNNNNLKARKSIRNDSNIIIDSPCNKEGITGTDFKNERKNSDRERDNHFRDERSIKFSDRRADSDLTRGSAAADSDRGNHTNEARKRLDLCIAELNEIIRDACVIFAGGRSAGTRRNS